MDDADRGGRRVVFDKLDAALTASEEDEKDFQIRQAQQILVGMED